MVVAKAVKRVSDLLDRFCSIVLVILLAGMVLVTLMQIICRVFFDALTWSEEVARYLLVWSTFIGAGCVYKKGGHISVLIAQEYLPIKMQKLAQILVQLLCGTFFAIALYYGAKYVRLQGNQLSAALRIPMRLMYMAVPVGCSIMLLHALDNILQSLVAKEVAKL